MGLDHRIQETMLGAPRTEAEIMAELGPIGKAEDWSVEHLRQRLGELARQGRVLHVGDLWGLRRLWPKALPLPPAVVKPKAKR